MTSLVLREALNSCQGLPSPLAELPLDAIHFVDSAQGLSHVPDPEAERTMKTSRGACEVLTFLQQAVRLEVIGFATIL